MPVEDPRAIAAAIDQALLGTSDAERTEWAARARAYALQFDRRVVFDRMFSLTTHTTGAGDSRSVVNQDLANQDLANQELAP